MLFQPQTGFRTTRYHCKYLLTRLNRILKHICRFFVDRLGGDALAGMTVAGLLVPQCELRLPLNTEVI